MKRWGLWLHRWLGLLSVLLLLISGVSGSLLVFRAELEQTAGARPLPAAVPVSLQRLADAVEASYPGVAYNLRFAPDRHHGVRARVEGRDGIRLVWLDPGSARVTSDRPQDRGALNWAFVLHENLMLGEAGEWLTGAGALLLALVSLSGVLVWWPRSWRDAWRWRGGRSVRSQVVALHRQLGILLMPLLLIAAVSGLCLVFDKPLHRWINARAGDVVARPLTLPAVNRPRLPLDQLVASAERAMPGGRLVDIRVDARANRPVVIRKRLPGEVHPNGRSLVELDPHRGTVLRATPHDRAPAAMTFNAWVYAWHVGEYGGLVHRLILQLGALGLVLLCCSGAYQWAVRRRQRRYRCA